MVSWLCSNVGCEWVPCLSDTVKGSPQQWRSRALILQLEKNKQRSVPLGAVLSDYSLWATCKCFRRWKCALLDNWSLFRGFYKRLIWAFRTNKSWWRGRSHCTFLSWWFTAQQLREAQCPWPCLFLSNCVMSIAWGTGVDSSYSNVPKLVL